jgi:hypothetical protein
VLALGVVARVEVGGDLAHAPHSKLRRSQGVDRRQNSPGLHAGGRLEVGHLPQSVDTGIRATRRYEVHGVTKDLRRRPLDLTGDGALIRLHLPAGKGRPFVFDEQLEVASGLRAL